MADEGRIIDQKSPEGLGLEPLVEGVKTRNYAGINEQTEVLASEDDNNHNRDTGKFSWSWIYGKFLYHLRSYLRVFTEDEFTDPNMIPNVLYAAANKTLRDNATTVLFTEDRTSVDATTTLSGNLTFDFTDAKNGAQVVLRHNSPSEPTYSQQPIWIGGNGYVDGVNNLYFLKYINDGTNNVIYGWITQENAAPNVTGGTVDGHIHSNLALLETITVEMLLTQEQRDKIASIVPGYVGYFQTPVLLNQAFPSPTENQFAKVGSTDTIWVEDNGAWIDSTTNDASVVLDATQVKTLYESNADTNAFTDAEKAKLAGLSATPPSSGGGGLELIETIEITGTTAQVEFTGLDANALQDDEGYVIKCEGMVQDAINDRELNLRFNNDSSSSNYIADNANSGLTFIKTQFEMSFASDPNIANYKSNGTVYIPFPKQRVLFVYSFSVRNRGSDILYAPDKYTTNFTSNNGPVLFGDSAWEGTANITSIQLFPQNLASSFKEGKISLYKGVF